MAPVMYINIFDSPVWMELFAFFPVVTVFRTLAEVEDKADESIEMIIDCISSRKVQLAAH